MKTEHYNMLSEAEQERLVIVAEECAEVIHAVTKILRHGFESHHPKTPRETNRSALTRELADMFWAVNALGRNGDIDPVLLDSLAHRDKPEAHPYLHHQGKKP